MLKKVARRGRPVSASGRRRAPRGLIHRGFPDGLTTTPDLAFEPRLDRVVLRQLERVPAALVVLSQLIYGFGLLPPVLGRVAICRARRVAPHIPRVRGVAVADLGARG